MLDIISIGSATEDVFVYMPKEFMGKNTCTLYPGSKVEIEGMEYHTGGGATNTSVAFSRLGLRAGVICALGQDESAGEILKELRKEGVNSSNAKKLAGKHTAYSVILTGKGKDRIILHYGGTTAMLSHIKINWGKLKSKWLYISSLHSDSGMLYETAKHAKKTGSKISFNPGKKEIALGLEELKKIFGKIEVLTLNSEEALKLTGSVDIHRNLAKLSAFASFVAITEGKDGAHVTDGKKIYSMRPFDVKVADVTGAGDAFGSAFTSAISLGKGVDEALVWGCANASSVVMHLGTKNILLTRTGMKNFIRKYKSRESEVVPEQI